MVSSVPVTELLLTPAIKCRILLGPQVPVPVIGVVTGLAAAAGCQLIASCDLVMAMALALLALILALLALILALLAQALALLVLALMALMALTPAPQVVAGPHAQFSTPGAAVGLFCHTPGIPLARSAGVSPNDHYHKTVFATKYDPRMPLIQNIQKSTGDQ